MIRENRRQLLKHAFGAAALILLIHTLFAAHFGVFDGRLHGTNTYSWLVRVLHLHETGSWFNATIPRIDPPYGHEQHWTRPFDVLLFIGAWIGAPLVGFKNGLHVWGVLISPILQILALIAFFWAVRPLFSNRQIYVLGILFVFQIVIIVSFRAGRPDHQSLIYLLFIVSLGFGTRLLVQPFRLRWCYWAGFVSALALWVSVESVLVILMNLFCLGLFWFLGDDDLERKLFHYSLSLFLGSAAALLVQRGVADLLKPELDQISIAFVSLFALIFAFWAAVSRVRVLSGTTMGWGRRLTLAVVGAAMVIAAMEFLYPGFFRGPANVDKLYIMVRLQHIGETQPVFSGGWQSGLMRFFIFLGIAVPTIPVLVYLLVKRYKPDVRFWAYLSIGLVIFAPRALRQVRWAPYVGILFLPAYAWLVSKVLERVENRVSRGQVLLFRPLLLFLCATWYVLPAVLLVQQSIDTNWRIQCPLSSLSRYLDDPEEWGDRPRNILAFADYGPELLYRTKHSVYSIASHRFQRGFTDSYNIMSASTDRKALEIIRGRKVDLILICAPRDDKWYVREDGRETFYDRLSADKIPPWIRKVRLPDDVSEDFRLYEVRLAAQ
jgi:hypothetical protein